jgi:membrane protein implicated in regulation of membrane protease activity
VITSLYLPILAPVVVASMALVKRLRRKYDKKPLRNYQGGHNLGKRREEKRREEKRREFSCVMLYKMMSQRYKKPIQ